MTRLVLAMMDCRPQLWRACSLLEGWLGQVVREIRKERHTLTFLCTDSGTPSSPAVVPPFQKKMLSWHVAKAYCHLQVGMVTVPKPGSNKHHLVTDHSAGQFALNNMISRDDIAGVTLDNVQDLGNALRYLHQQDPNIDLILWKADVSEAYRHMPMHPLWQIKQAVHRSTSGTPSCSWSPGLRS